LFSTLPTNATPIKNLYPSDNGERLLELSRDRVPGISPYVLPVRDASFAELPLERGCHALRIIRLAEAFFEAGKEERDIPYPCRHDGDIAGHVLHDLVGEAVLGERVLPVRHHDRIAGVDELDHFALV